MGLPEHLRIIPVPMMDRIYILMTIGDTVETQRFFKSFKQY